MIFDKSVSISSTIKYCLYITFLNMLLLCHCEYPVTFCKQLKNHFDGKVICNWDKGAASINPFLALCNLG